MKRSSAFLSTVGIAVAVLGCSRTVTGGFDDSPDGQYRVWIRTFGAYGHSFRDKTPKTIRLSLVQIIGVKTNWNERPLFTKEYHFTCSDVLVDTSWDKQDNLTAVIYDYPQGVYWETARKERTPSNYIATISLLLNRETGMIQEKEM